MDDGNDRVWTGLIPPASSTDHPCHDVSKGERLLKDIYEAIRAGPSWSKTMLLVAYDDVRLMYFLEPSARVANLQSISVCTAGRRDIRPRCSSARGGSHGRRAVWPLRPRQIQVPRVRLPTTGAESGFDADLPLGQGWLRLPRVRVTLLALPLAAVISSSITPARQVTKRWLTSGGCAGRVASSRRRSSSIAPSPQL